MSSGVAEAGHSLGLVLITEVGIALIKTRLTGQNKWTFRFILC